MQFYHPVWFFFCSPPISSSPQIAWIFILSHRCYQNVTFIVPSFLTSVGCRLTFLHSDEIPACSSQLLFHVSTQSAYAKKTGWFPSQSSHQIYLQFFNKLSTFHRLQVPFSFY